jgi:glycosyltransferase involved in cell wall biosynthesis
MGELLAAGRPILVHAPRDSFIAWYFTQHRCGLVVDKDDPAELAQGIDLLLSDGELRASLAKAARERAAADFDLDTARQAFLGLLQMNGSQTAATDQGRRVEHE